MKMNEETKNRLSISYPTKDGVHTATNDPGVIVQLDNTIKVECRVHRSYVKNTNLAIQLIDLALSDT